MPPQDGFTRNRAIAQPFMRELAREPISGAEGLSRLREAGLGYRTSDFYSDWRRERGLVLHEYACGQLRSTSLPPDRLWTETPWEGLRTSLLYEFTITGTDEATGETFSRFGAVGSDRALTVGEVKDMYLQEYVLPEVYGRLTDVELTLTSVRHKVGGEVFS